MKKPAVTDRAKAIKKAEKTVFYHQWEIEKTYNALLEIAAVDPCRARAEAVQFVLMHGSILQEIDELATAAEMRPAV